MNNRGLARDGFMLAVSTVFSGMVRAAALAVLARKYAPAELALWFLWSSIGGVALSLDLGIQQYLRNAIALASGNHRALVVTAAAFTVPTAAIGAVGAYIYLAHTPVAAGIPWPVKLCLVTLTAMQLPFGMWSNTLLGLGRNWRYSAWSIVWATVPPLVFAALAYGGVNLLTGLLCFTAAQTILCISASISVVFSLDGRVTLREIRLASHSIGRSWKISLGLFCSCVAGAYLASYVNLAGSKLLEPTELGNLNLIFRYYFIGSSLSNALLVPLWRSFTIARSDTARTKQILLVSILTATAPIVLLGICDGLTGNHIRRLLLGGAGSALPAEIIIYAGIAIACQAGSSAVVTALAARGQGWLSALFNLGAVCVYFLVFPGFHHQASIGWALLGFGLSNSLIAIAGFSVIWGRPMKPIPVSA